MTDHRWSVVRRWISVETLWKALFIGFSTVFLHGRPARDGGAKSRGCPHGSRRAQVNDLHQYR